MIPEHRLFRRRRRAPAAKRRGAGAAARCAPSPTCAPATSSSTRTTGSRASPASNEDGRRRHARLPEPRVRRHRQGLPAGRPVRQDQPLRRRRRRASAALEARRHALGDDEVARPPRGAGARGRADEPLRRAPPPRTGHAFPPDSDWQRDFEDAGPYRETPDQREAIEQVKIDMETARPMDRLDLRRRRLRQDGGRAARRVQGRQRRQAGDGAACRRRSSPSSTSAPSPSG